MSRNIRTFRDLGADDHPSDSDDSGADTERGAPQEFYAGSGQAVQGPRGARNPDSEAHIRRILQAAEAIGPEEASQGRSSGQPEDLVTLTLHLWVDGLSIDDGPLMRREDPATMAFLEEVGQGQIPSAIARKHPGKKIDFKIDRHIQEYVAPKMKPFAGNGVRLGNVVPNVVGESSSVANPIVVEDTSAAELAKQLEDAKKELNTDMAQPTTNIQVRLPNNQRLVGVFNHSHTLSALRLFICTARPELIYQPFQLMSAYPPKVFEDETQTLKDANCLNSVITIKMSLKAWLGIDKIQKLGQIVKEIGGVKAVLKKRYLMDVTRVGTLVGTDKFGNRYYENNEYFIPRNRWVEFPDKVWLDYDATQVPPEWHSWLHHITDDTPVVKPPPTPEWVLEHKENTSIFADKKYIPYSTTRTKIQGWQPGQKPQSE